MAEVDLILRDCLVYDGRGGKPSRGDIGIQAGRIGAIQPGLNAKAPKEIPCGGLAAAPGFINLHSWAATDLLAEGGGMSDLLQGVTLEVFGESWSEGPLSPAMKAYIQGLYGMAEIPWTSLADFLAMLEENIGVPLNVASFVGVDNLRYHTVGMEDRPATDEEVAEMVALLEGEMRAGAMGVGSALIYIPGMYFQTGELRRLAQAAFRHGGAYISHIRSEGDRFDEALEEFLDICLGGRGILYHFKVQGEKNWHKLEDGLQHIAAAQAAGTQVGACVYPYTAGMTSLSNVLPPWARAGGQAEMLAVIASPENRRRLLAEIEADQDEWENLYLLAGRAKGTKVMNLMSASCAGFNGAWLEQVAARMGKAPAEAILELILAEGGEAHAIFFHGSEANLRRVLQQPYVCLGSDIGSFPAEAGKLSHPRAFGTFARFLGRLCRDEGLLPFEEGIRRITSLPAEMLGIQKQRGSLLPGYAADVVIFDPATLLDHATYEDPLQYASGVKHVLVNGVPVVEDGAPSGAKPGRFVRGPGCKPG